VCVPACPADATFEDDDVPSDQDAFIELNAELAALWPVITEKKEPLTDADDWDGAADKIQYPKR
jgi:ferredoxin